jgi:(p)ppGpp synthase/HD superfamily hydrolase
VNQTPPHQFTLLTHRFSEALTGAANLHANQTKKGTTVPYIAHLLGVASIALHYGADEDEAIAALLHDAIEDAPSQLGPSWVRSWIQFRFGARALRIVEGCTDLEASPKPPWLERKAAYVAHLQTETDPSVVLVSAADKLHNSATILHDFRQLGNAVFDRYDKSAGKPGVVGYYRAVTEAFRQIGHHPVLVSELDRVVTELERETGVKGKWPPASHT